MSVNTDRYDTAGDQRDLGRRPAAEGHRAADDFFDLGGTSLDLIRVFGRLNEKFGLSLDGSVLGDEATIERLTAAVDARAQELNTSSLEKTMDTIQKTPHNRSSRSAPKSSRSSTSAATPARSRCTSPTRSRRIWKRQRLQLMDRSHAAYPMDTMSGNTNIANYDRHLDNEFLAEHVGRPEIVHRMISILGPDMLMWRSEFFSKYPGEEGTDWHQADTFADGVGQTADRVAATRQDAIRGCRSAARITVWCAFTEASEETGCLQFIPGTHKLDVLRRDQAACSTIPTGSTRSTRTASSAASGATTTARCRRTRTGSPTSRRPSPCRATPASS